MARAKSEIDKNHLYNLLMPSDSAAEVLPYQMPLAPQKESPPGDDSLRDLRERLSKETLTALPSKEDSFLLVNIIELMISERLDLAFEKFNCCRCDKCKKRAAAFALNELSSNYIAANPQQISDILKVYPSKDVTAAIVKSILRIKGSPEH